MALSVEQYEHRFYELKQYAGIGDDEAMLVQHFIRGLNARISGRVRVFKPKTMEVAVEKACIVEENLTLALGGQTGVQIGSAPIAGFGPRGGQIQTGGSSRNQQAPAKAGQLQQKRNPQKNKNTQPQQGNSFWSQHGGGWFQNERDLSWQQVQHDHFDQPAQSSQSAVSGGSFPLSSVPPSDRGFIRSIECYTCGQQGHIARQYPQKKIYVSLLEGIFLIFHVCQ